MSGKSFQLPQHVRLPEPLLRFGTDNPHAVDIHPLEGLLRFGPYSSKKLAAISNPIRVAIIAPHGKSKRVLNLLIEIEQQHYPKERKTYLRAFPGFSKVFHASIAPATEKCVVEISADITARMKDAEKPHTILAEALSRSLHSLRNIRHDFDLVLFLLDEEWEDGFYGSDGDDFDLHDYMKALAASNGMCIQILREGSAMNYFCRCSVMWRLGIALYTKAGGIPWVLAESDPRTAFIGIDYAVKSHGEEPRFAICCSQVFDAEGSGLEFVAYEANGVSMFGKNPFLKREQMLKVMTRSLNIYQRKHVGEVPKRIVVHKNTEFKKDEIEGVFDAFPNVEDIELIHVQRESNWTGIYIPERLKPHGYPCPRGSMLQIGGSETLLWTQGNLPAIAQGKDYFKEGKGIPNPLLLVRYAGQGDVQRLCEETLALTKMDWNNDGPYDRMPVTLNFAGTLATIVKRMPKLEPTSYPFRLFM